VNSNNEGIAIYYPGGYPYSLAVSFGGASTGVYGQAANYFAPYTTLTLEPKTVYEFDMVLVAGDVATARDVIDALRIAGADSASPVGTIELPVEGATLSGVATVAGWAFDNMSVDRIDVLVDGLVVGAATRGQRRPDVVAEFPGAPPDSGYRYALNTLAYSDGAHTLSANVYDPNGFVAALPERTVAIDNVDEPSPPVAMFTSPRAGGSVRRSARVTIAASAEGSAPIERVEFYVDGSLLATCFTGVGDVYSATWTVPEGPRRQYRLSTKAYDSSGKVGTSSILTVQSR
jgi:hypothetical protein